MEKNQGLYYLGRVQKGGELDNDLLSESILNPKTIVARNNAWTFIESQGFEKFIFSKLVKFQPSGEVFVVDDEDKTEKKQIEPNLRVAISPFIYIPEYSGICFLNVSNHIYDSNFGKYFSRIVKETNNDFFVDCEVEMIVDMRAFAQRIINLRSIDRIFAKINPPNPLYGPLWERLKDYLERRNTNNLSLDEKSDSNSSLNSKIGDHLRGIIDQTEENPYMPEDVDISDAAILMAADGYGNGKIEGTETNKYVVIKTSETSKNFRFDRDPDPQELYNFALEELVRINDERHLDH
ncbi:MAG: hypothetical protein WEA58_15600 [Balneolaceae bacterium]